MQNKQPHHHTNVEENTKFLFEFTPFKLDKTDNIVQEIGLYYLPFSTGFEVECSMNPDYPLDKVKNIFSNIPNIIQADVNNGEEQRFRIPKGIDGLLCLFCISDALKKYAYPNPQSGIHYHVDCTDVFNLIDTDVINKNKEWMLSDLDKWKYKGSYNNRNIVKSSSSAVWVRFQSGFKTAEFRIGEMTFDYNLLFKRITSANDIIRRLRFELTPIHQRYGDNAVDIINNRKIEI